MDYLGELVTFALGVTGTYLGLGWKVRKDLEAEYDKTLRDARLRVYQSLWGSLEPLAMFSRPAPVTFQTVKGLSAELRRWYFAEGGLYLSDATRDVYFELQDKIGHVIEDPAKARSPNGELDSETFEMLRKAGSRVRTAMAADVGTRRKPLMKTEVAA